MSLNPAILHIVPRAVAKRVGLKRYFTGNPCPFGHVGERFVGGGQCVACSAARTIAWRSRSADHTLAYGERYRRTNRDKILTRKRKHLAENVDAERARKRADYHRHADQRKATTSAWRKANPCRVRSNMRAWREANRDDIRAYNRANSGKKNAIVRARRARLLQALPGWLKPEDFAVMSAIYVEAARLSRETGVTYQVDHVIPLQGRLVCGLHVPTNLQILTATANREKSNRYTP